MRSSVLVWVPHCSVKVYFLSRLMNREIVFVACPKAMGSSPVAKGSRVPACPIRQCRLLMLAIWRSLEIHRMDVRPAGLSRNSQPLRLWSRAGEGVSDIDSGVDYSGVAVAISGSSSFLRSRLTLGECSRAVMVVLCRSPSSHRKRSSGVKRRSR